MAFPRKVAKDSPVGKLKSTLSFHRFFYLFSFIVVMSSLSSLSSLSWNICFYNDIIALASLSIIQKFNNSKCALFKFYLKEIFRYCIKTLSKCWTIFFFSLQFRCSWTIICESTTMVRFEFIWFESILFNSITSGWP